VIQRKHWMIFGVIIRQNYRRNETFHAILQVRVYESSGDQQARLLADRLQREVSLSAQVKELSAKVQHLISENRCLEEEKCEMEEAENDTRLRCQK